MNWNLFWGFYTLAFSIACLLAWYIFGYRKSNIDKKCTEKTTGKIIRYSYILYNKVSLPVVQYFVNDKSYTVVGPKFKGSVILKTSTPFNNIKADIESNLTTREELPDVLKLKVKRNSYISYQTSPLLELFPIDSSVNVYYNPNNPKMAYVERFVKPTKWFIISLIFGIICLGLSLFFFFGPEIIM